MSFKHSLHCTDTSINMQLKKIINPPTSPLEEGGKG